MAQGKIRLKGKMHNGIKSDDLLAFFQQLATLVDAGTPLYQSLTISAKQSESIKLSATITRIAERVAAGTAMNDALKEYPKVFEPHWISVIKTGEVTGKMALVLKQLTINIRVSKDTQGKIIGAMMYPAILALVALGALVVMLWKVVPTFAEFFQDFGKELPPITQAVINASDFLNEHGIPLVLGIGAATFAIRYYIRTPKGGRVFNGLLIRAPAFGELVIQGAMEKFASNMSLLLVSGIPLLQGLQAVQSIFHKNPIYLEALQEAEAQVASGRSLAVSLEETGLFTPMLISMVKVGEESGTLADVLDQIASFYRQKIDGLIRKVTGLVEPVIVLGMGVVVALLLMSIYLPMFSLASGAG